MVRTEREMAGVYGPVLLTTQPAPRGFIYKYMLGLTPIILVALSLIALSLLHIVVNGFPPSLVHSLEKVVPDLPELIELCVLLITPVGIFLFAIWFGDVIHHPEIWTGAALTLLLCGIGAMVIVQGMDLPVLSAIYLLAVFQWVAYLVQPSSVVAAVVVTIGIEAFRRSLHYTLTRDVLIITGGIWNQVENLIPLDRIEKIVLVQSRLGHLFHFGTVVPAGKVFGLSEIDMTGQHLLGDLLHPDTDQISTMRWQRGSHNPLVCLYGIRNPEDVKVRLKKAIQQISQKS